MTRILLVEDDASLRRALALTLRARGHVVAEEGTGMRAVAAVARDRPEVVILDLGLPDLDGVEVIHRVREHHEVPVIVLSARRDQSDKVAALDAGADDYLTKPFGLEELLARVRAAVRRSSRGVDRVIVTQDFAVDLGMKTVTGEDGRPIHLTPTEWQVLEVLVRADGLLVPSDTLLTEVWGPGYEGQTNYLRVYVGQLRRKLEPVPGTPRYLHTSPGFGYRFDPGPPPAPTSG